MLTIYSNEVDIEFSDLNSDNCTDRCNELHVEDEDECSSSYEKSASENKTNSSIFNSQSYSYYNRKKLNSTDSIFYPKLDEIDQFDPNNLLNHYKDVDYTGDKVDSSESTKTSAASHAFEEALRISRLRKEIVTNSNLSYKQGKLFNKAPSKSSISSVDTKKKDRLPSTKKYLSSQTIGQFPKTNFKISSGKNFSEIDSVTLLIRVPRNKLMNHIKNKTMIESWKTISSKSSSVESLSSSVDKDSETLQHSLVESNRKTEKSEMISESDITSIIDRSKEIIECCKESMKKSNKKLQTLIKNNIIPSNQSDKITQTLSNQQESFFNSSKNYFLCNICHKIVPANLSPICLKLSCSAIKKCDLIFHGELDMIMHLPVKHSIEFASYNICNTCNRMYPPSNIVTIKGSYNCLDCVSSLLKLKTEK